MKDSAFEHKIIALESENKILHDKIANLEKRLQDYEAKPQECFSNMAKYVVPKIRNNNYEMFVSEYKYNGVSDRLLSDLNSLSKSKFCWLAENNKLWLLYLQILLENNIMEGVEVIANRYLHFHELKEIEYFPIVANYFDKLGLSNEQTKKCSMVYEKLLESEKNQDFENIVKGKSIAVVGNGPYELGKHKGKEIDAHDVVIRFSRGVEKGYEQDYGSKTTVWVNTTANIYVQEYDKTDYELSLWRFDSFYFKDTSGLESIYSVIDKKCQKFGIDTANYAWNELGLNYILTTGCDLIIHLYNILNSFENISFYGFHFLNNFSNDDDIYFFAKKPYTPCSYHDLDSEPLFMRKFILERGGKLNEN